MDAAFCLYCYMFPPENARGGDAFSSGGYTHWNKAKRFSIHEGGPNGAHFKASQKYQNLKNQKQDIRKVLIKQTQQENMEYRIRLNASVDVTRFLLRQGLAFRGHREHENSCNRGNFLELLKFLGDHNEEINKVMLCNAPKNNKVTHHDTQKQIVNAAAVETTNSIIQDLGDTFFSILVDESRDASVKEQMYIVLRYVNKKGLVIERFLAIVHVSDTAATTLKSAIDGVFSKHNLSFSKVCGQGYDGASNMRGEINGLKALILTENKSAHYIHCFAHQLQLTLVAVSKNQIEVNALFVLLGRIVNVVGASCKRRDQLRENQASRIVRELEIGEIKSGRGLNQETNLQSPGDTRWGSHYDTIISTILLFPSIIDVIGFVEEEATQSDQKVEARFLIEHMECFEFVFSLHLMRNVLSVTNELSVALQIRDQDILNAMSLVNTCKNSLQKMRSSQVVCESLLKQVSSFCEKNDIPIPNMKDKHVMLGRSRRKAPNKSNYEYYWVDFFCAILDRQLQELNNRFTEASTQLFISVAALNPSFSFAAYNKVQLIRLAKLYPADFSEADVMKLDGQLENYINVMRSNDKFSNLKGIGELVQKLVELEVAHVYPLVFRLLQLALVLPVATASVERSFSVMKILKTRLRSRMDDDWLNDCMVTYIEKEVFDRVSSESIMKQFQNSAPRRGHY